MGEATRETIEKRALLWISGPDTGLSSKCIWRTMQGLPEPDHWWYGDYPYDPADFQRCRLLLKAIPEWRGRLPEMAVHGPVWAALAERWDEIEALFVEEVGDEPRRTAMAPRTYALMQQIIDRAEAVRTDTEAST